MKINYILLAIGLMFVNTSYGQDACATDFILRKKALDNPLYQEAVNNAFETAQLHANSQNKQAAEVYEIPVVFHIVYASEDQNLSDEVIFDQIEILNQDYRRTNPNADETRDIFIDRAADAEIQFVLADTDPFGNPSNGITRTFTTTDFEMDIFSGDGSVDIVKKNNSGGKDAWDTQNYLNIWVCNIQSGFIGQVFGYAYPPEGVANWPDGSSASSPELEGVVLHYTIIGSNNPEAGEDGVDLNDGGRTATHEIGHYLGLRHIWGDAFIDGCTVDDGIDDTPNAATSANFTCDYEKDTCEEDDEPDMVENYMDYSTDDCLNMFTKGQVDHMRSVIEIYRSDLVNGNFAVSVEELSDQTTFYPNPVDKTVTFQNDASQVFQISIIDVLGRQVKDFDLQENDQSSVDLSSLPSGIYIVNWSQKGALIRQDKLHKL